MDKDVFKDKLWKWTNCKLYLKIQTHLSDPCCIPSAMFVQAFILLNSPQVPISISYPPRLFFFHFPFICQALLSSEITTYVTKQKGWSVILPMRLGRSREKCYSSCEDKNLVDLLAQDKDQDGEGYVYGNRNNPVIQLL